MVSTKSLVASSCLLAALVGSVAGQAQAPACPAPACPPPACPAPCCPAPCKKEEPVCLWGSVEALFWWVQDASVAPLVTTNPDPNRIAALNEPGTTTLFGGSAGRVDYGSLTGVRGTIGGWLPDSDVGVEGSLFGLPRQGVTFTANAPGGGGPVIAVPFNSTVPFNFNPAGETTLNPGNVASQITVNATTLLWGADALGLVSLLASDNYNLSFLGGFKYLDLDESLSVSQVFLDPRQPGTLVVRDGFSSRNQFYGLSLGLRGGVGIRCVSLNVTGKLGIGGTQQEYSAAGTSTALGTPFGLLPGVTPAGLFAQPSNSGEFAKNAFTLVPEVTARLAVEPFRNLQLWVGYDFLYSNNVVRAATQIDRNVNATQNPTFLIPGGGLPAPTPSFVRTDFWAQGISTGVQLRY